MSSKVDGELEARDAADVIEPKAELVATTEVLKRESPQRGLSARGGT